MQKLRKLFKSKKVVVIALLSFLLLGIYLILRLKKPEGEVVKISPTPVPSLAPGITKLSPAPPELRSGGTYFINAIINTKTPVTGFSWTDKDFILYSTPNGIFKATDNTPIKEAKIDYITWSENAQALYRENGVWWLFRAEHLDPELLNVSFNNPALSPNASSVAYPSGKTLYLFDLATKSVLKHDFEISINKFIWGNTSDAIVLSLRYNNRNNIVVLNKSLEVKKNLNFSNTSELVSFSPDAKKITVQEGNQVILYNIENDSKIGINLTKDTKILSEWVDNDKFILIETGKDDLDRQFDYFYLVNTKGEKVYLANSLPIINKLNTNLKPKVNNQKNIVLFSENKSKLWILSLIAETLPTFSSGGLHLNRIPAKSHEFVEP